MHKLQRAGPLPTTAARRLLRKLTVRNLQRKNGLPLFNLAFSETGYTHSDPCFINDSQFERVLDRFKVCLKIIVRLLFDDIILRFLKSKWRTLNSRNPRSCCVSWEKLSQYASQVPTLKGINFYNFEDVVTDLL